RKLDAEHWMAIQHSPAIAMAMDRELAEITNCFYAAQPDAVERDHRGSAAGLHDLLVVASQLINFIADIERVHHFLAGAIGVGIDDTHDRTNSFIKRRVR